MSKTRRSPWIQQKIKKLQRKSSIIKKINNSLFPYNKKLKISGTAPLIELEKRDKPFLPVCCRTGSLTLHPPVVWLAPIPPRPSLITVPGFEPERPPAARLLHALPSTLEMEKKSLETNCDGNGMERTLATGMAAKLMEMPHDQVCTVAMRFHCPEVQLDRQRIRPAALFCDAQSVSSSRAHGHHDVSLYGAFKECG